HQGERLRLRGRQRGPGRLFCYQVRDARARRALRLPSTREAKTMKELRIGLVGAGWMGKVHAMAYRTARQAFGPQPGDPGLAGIAEVNAALADFGATEYGCAKATTDWREIVDDPTIDIVDICTPNDMHFDVAMAAIAAGKHVYCEKPLANTVEMARQMTEA